DYEAITNSGGVNRKKVAHTCHGAPKTVPLALRFGDLPPFPGLQRENSPILRLPPPSRTSRQSASGSDPQSRVVAPCRYASWFHSLWRIRRIPPAHVSVFRSAPGSGSGLR